MVKIKNPKALAIGFGCTLLVLSFVLNNSLKTTIKRQKAIDRAKAESKVINHKIHTLQKQLARLNKSPEEYEYLVRRELGYLKPGEKEIRFSN